MPLAAIVFAAMSHFIAMPAYAPLIFFAVFATIMPPRCHVCAASFAIAAIEHADDFCFRCPPLQHAATLPIVAAAV